MNKKQMEAEIEALKKEIKEFQQKEVTEPPANASVSALVKYLIEERERTNRILSDLVGKVRGLEEEVEAMEMENTSQDDYAFASSKEIALSNTDAKIVNFVQTQPKEMACAEEVRKYMGYKGNNAACARLKSLEKMGLLQRHQLGHKVYYKVDAGKATTLIVSPPQ